jgi:hypothetical protein
MAAVVAFAPGAVQAQDFLSGGARPGGSGEPAAGTSASSASFADGTRAINQGRWNDAIAIFSKIADQKGDYADGALYWNAYAENKLGNSGLALDTCTVLLHQYPTSSWIEDCGALKIEIRAKNGAPVQPSAAQSDELKLLALASLMSHDEKRALAEIDEILNGDSSEKLKQGALFIMREHHTDTIYPQIARVSYVEGDVRVSRGEESKHGKDSDWEQAVTNLPLQTGYSLVTGKGRAEIEFENDSTLYLGEDSVLLFNDLHTTAGVPRTEVALLSGMVTLHIEPSVPGEWFVLKTPNDTLSTKYPNATNFRVNSYMDGIGLTPLVASGLMTTGSQVEALIPGKTLYYKDGRPIVEAGPIHPPDFAAWDNWVAARYAERQNETAAALKASGLATPIPGLADLAQKGTFFSCEPYGTCWQPNPQQNVEAGNGLVASGAQQNKPVDQAEVSPANVQPAAPGSKIGFLGKPMPTSTPSSADLADMTDMESFFPCMPDEVRFLLMRNVFGGPQMLNPALWYYGEPWEWAVCHSGSWINRNNRYVWVVGKPHHRPPVRWIKSGHTVGFVPLHPYDIKGRPPVNREIGVFAVDPKGAHPVERVELQPDRRVELLNEPPRGYRTEFVPPLARAAEPHILAHEVKDFDQARSSVAKSPGIPITFDRKSQTFVMTHQVMQGGRSVTVMAPVGNRDGSLQSRGYYGGGGASGGGGGVSRAGSYAGGGSRASTGSSGGGYHGGGGGVSSGSASVGGSSAGGSSAGSAAGSSASSGGGGGSSGGGGSAGGGGGSGGAGHH